jgi:hypothetical protein
VGGTEQSPGRGQGLSECLWKILLGRWRNPSKFVKKSFPKKLKKNFSNFFAEFAETAEDYTANFVYNLVEVLNTDGTENKMRRQVIV